MTARNKPQGENAKFAVQIGKASMKVRKSDLYETPPCAVHALIKSDPVFSRPVSIWDPCCGPGVITRELRGAGHTVFASELVDYRGRRCPGSEVGWDFLLEQRAPVDCNMIVMNPPFSLADEFVSHALHLVDTVFVLQRLAYLEGVDGKRKGSGLRSKLIDVHLSRVWMGLERLPFMHRDGYEGPRNSNSAAPFAWFVFKRDRGLGGAIELNRISWRFSAVKPKPKPKPKPTNVVDIEELISGDVKTMADVTPNKRPTPTQRVRRERKKTSTPSR